MNFSESVKNGFKNYLNTSGRATRSEYIYFNLFFFLVMVATLFLDIAFGGEGTEESLVVIVFSLILLPAVFCNIIRRLHDLNLSGYWVILIFIISIFIGEEFLLHFNFIVFAFLSGIPGTMGLNKYDVIGDKDEIESESIWNQNNSNNQNDENEIDSDSMWSDDWNDKKLIYSILKIKPSWEKEKINTHLKNEFKKWNSRYQNLSEGDERDHAQLMLNYIGKVRKNINK